MSVAAHKSEAFPFGAIAFLAIPLAVGWVWLVATTHLYEMIVGAAVVVIATLFLLQVHRSQPNVIQLHWKDVVQGCRIPWYMVCDTAVLILVLFRDLFRLRPAGSYHLVCEFKCEFSGRI